MIRLILSSHDWDPNWPRIINNIHIQPELLPYANLPKVGEYLYNMSGYVIVAASVCKIIYSLGFTQIPIQTILHGLNVVVQTLTVFLLFSIGKKLNGRALGLLAATFFTVFPLAVLEAHYERIESWLCLLATATLYCSFSFRTAPLRQSFLIGALIGLALVTKVNLLYLGFIPAILLVNFWLDTTSGSLAQRNKKFGSYGALVITGILLAASINSPYLMRHIPETIEATKNLANFYMTPEYPYAEEHYSYFSQLLVCLRYFWFTLGPLWCIFAVAGLLTYKKNSEFYWMLTVPLLCFIFFSALQVNFFERNYSPLEGYICLIAALGVFYIQQWSKHFLTNSAIRIFTPPVIVFSMLYTPLKLDTDVVSHYMKNSDKPPRNAFQEILKNDFPGFWIKNISVVYKDKHPTPERPPKAPRIYQLDDLNDHWSRDALLALQTQGFKKVAIYCSEFSHLPPNTFTIYHAAAKNHYFVREDEWPAEVPRDYFKTNCP